MSTNPVLADEIHGARLYGEGLDDAGLTEWFAAEAKGCFGPPQDEDHIDDEADEREEAISCQSFNHFHMFRHLPPGKFNCCVALGASNGREYLGIADRIGHFVAIEPQSDLWRSDIGGTPADYRLPSLRGNIDLPDGSCDLAGSFGVLHHIANVSEVLGELARVLKPGAPLMIREPISSLGDFRRPRLGLTINERGIPHRLMDQMLKDAGFDIRRKAFVRFPRLNEAAWRLGLKRPSRSPLFLRLDAFVCGMMAWNVRYWRPRLLDKLAPGVACWLAVRR